MNIAIATESGVASVANKFSFFLSLFLFLLIPVLLCCRPSITLVDLIIYLSTLLYLHLFPYSLTPCMSHARICICREMRRINLKKKMAFQNEDYPQTQTCAN